MGWRPGFFIPAGRADFALRFMSGTELLAGYPEQRQRVSLADCILGWIRTELFLVAAANARPGQFLSTKPTPAGGFHPARAGHLHRKPNPGLLSHGSFPNTFPAVCWHSAAPMLGSASMRSGPQISGCHCPVVPRALSNLTSMCLICELNYTCALPADCPAAVGIPAWLCCGAQPAPTAW